MFTFLNKLVQRFMWRGLHKTGMILSSFIIYLDQTQEHSVSVYFISVQFEVWLMLR